MKYIAINPDQIECIKCGSRFSSEASFCGFCGSPAVRKTVAMCAITKPEEVRKTPIEMKALEPRNDGTCELEFMDEFSNTDKKGSKALGIAVLSISVFAVLAMSLVLYFQATKTKKQPIVVEVGESEPLRKESATVMENKKAIQFTLSETKKGKLLKADGISIFIKQAKGSRYQNVEKRAKSVLIRLNHSLEKVHRGDCESNCFVAVRSGKNSEVRFVDSSAKSLRILDITPKDAKAEKSTPHIYANLLVDELNLMIELAPKALASNRSSHRFF